MSASQPVAQHQTAAANSPWDSNQSAPPANSASDITLVEGQTFAISAGAGDMSPDEPHGLFFLDTRFLSRFELRIQDATAEPLGCDHPAPFAATLAGQVLLGDHADAHLVVFRRRHVGQGMRERVSITNHQLEAADLVVEIRCEADFADLFAVKDRRVSRSGRPMEADGDHGVRFTQETDGGRSAKRTRLELSEPIEVDAEQGTIRLSKTLEPQETWDLCVGITVQLDGTDVVPRFSCGPDQQDQDGPAQQLASWQARLPGLSTDHDGLLATVTRSAEDLGALRIFDPEHPEVPIIAAGAPWFMTVFGRDSLLTGWMTLPADPTLAAGVLETLARFQGEDVRPDTEEEPGKILHEMRFDAAAGMALSCGHTYYGTVDATPLFVMLLGELHRWRCDQDLVDRLLPHADRALAWIEAFGDRDGDGYVEYRRQSDGGLSNQGWKDSWDAIRFRDATLADAPIALCEVQGYVYAAYQARALLADDAGDQATAQRCRKRAADLRRRFNEDFWMEDEGTFCLGLDADKRPIDAVASNVGHCLWTGIVDPERAEVVADRLLREDMFSGWGIRTLAASMTAYNPVSYHNGSVWPHDNALAIAGLVRYGHIEHAHRLIEGQIDAAVAHGDRLPELFAGFSRTELPVPGSYPSACVPQAWATGAPLVWLRSLLRLDPCCSHGTVWVSPELPPSIGHLHVSGIAVGDGRLDVEVDQGVTEVTMSSSDLELVREPRPIDEPA